MLSTDELYSLIIENYHRFEEVPDEAHVLCPKVNNQDANAYEAPDEPGDDITVEEKAQRIRDGQERFEITCNLSLMLGLNADQVRSWLEAWKTRLEACLRLCDKCVRKWHSDRESFLRRVSGYVTPLTWEEYRLSYSVSC